MQEIMLKHIVVGMIQTNCYFLINTETREGLIVDPGADPDRIKKEIKRLELKPQAILLTHGHGDHIGAVSELKRCYQLPVYIGAMEEKLFSDPDLNASGMMGEAISGKADFYVTDGELLELAGMQLKVIHTPGHTSGSICYYLEAESLLLSGDTLFEDSCGRTDLPTGSMDAIVNSITKKLFVLPEQVKVYPGHGNATTIEHEKRYNFINHIQDF